MKERCKTCPHLCKRLDSDDIPTRYELQGLSPEQALHRIEDTLKQELKNSGLQFNQSDYSCGFQLAILFDLKNSSMPAEDDLLLIIAQACVSATGNTELYLRYGLPENPKNYCDGDGSIPRQLSNAVEKAIRGCSILTAFEEGTPVQESQFGQGMNDVHS